MLQQIAVQDPITFRKSWRRKLTEKYKYIPTERKITGNTREDLPLNLSLSGQLWTQTASEGGDGEEVHRRGIV